MSEQMPLVLFHSPCVDGFTAAWACWINHPDWEYRPAIHGEPPPTDIKDRIVYMLDFSFKLPVIKEMAVLAKRIFIIDHHKSALREFMDYTLIPSNVEVIFDMERSGCHMAWDYFNAGFAAPFIVSAVEDRDIRKFALPGTRELNAVLFSYEYDFKTWDRLAGEFQNTTKRAYLIQEGAALDRKHMKEVRELIRHTRQDMCIAGHTVPACNLPYNMASDACRVLLEEEAEAPFAACWFENSSGRTFSLRSRNDGVDVSEIAKGYGGGGHPVAAGFRLAFGTTA